MISRKEWAPLNEIFFTTKAMNMKLVMGLLVLAILSIPISCTNERPKNDRNDQTANSDQPQTVQPGSDDATTTTAKARVNTKRDAVTLNLRGNIKSFTESEFDASLKSGKAQKGKLASRRVIQFNELGNQVAQSVFDARGSLKEKSTYAYDENLFKTEYILGKPDGGIDYKSTFRYDENGNMVEEVATYPDGSLYYKATFAYDDKGNQVEYTLFNMMGEPIKRITFVYGDASKPVEENVFKPDGALQYKYRYRYDEQGNIIEHSSYEPDNTLRGTLTYKYEYDNQGNWTRKTTYKNQKPIEIVERVIEYR
jgi:hypothetical protein